MFLLSNEQEFQDVIMMVLFDEQDCFDSGCKKARLEVLN